MPEVAVQGLSSAEVAERVRDGRANDLPAASGRSSWDIVRANVFTRINAILGVLLVIVLTTGSLINAAFGLLIVFNSAIGIVQELRAKRTLDHLAVVGEARPRVRRDGQVREIGRTEVVVDDVLLLAPGDQLLVDGELTEARSLEVDESLLTGEADPVVKEPGDSLLSGSFVVAGSGTYRATKVGRQAYAARLIEEASRFTLVGSELRAGINRILAVVSWLLVPVGLLTIWTQLLRLDSGWRAGILGMVAALVPMVPEGLVLLTSIAFAVGVIRLGRRQCLVQELPAIEGLARVDVVCADKTGTLTETGMRLTEVVALDGSGMPAGPGGADLLHVLSQLAATEANPNASIRAISESVPPASDQWREGAHAAFSSAGKWSGSTFDEHGSWLLGAPEVLASSGSPTVAEAERRGAAGLRVLLLASGSASVTGPSPTHGLTPRALVLLEQRIRPDARETLAYFAASRVSVKVLSGDNAVSVAAVTRNLGVPGGDDPVDARQLPAPDAEAGRFAEIVERHTVFGRVTPDQKRSMVVALKERGHTVAMTGDGVNDVLALKQADIGVAMGSGAPATRAVAQLVLLDNRFATLPHVVAEGRRVIGNIERVANLFLTKTVYSVLLALLVGLWQLPFPLQPIHVTITGWFTIGVPAFLLSLAPNKERARPGFTRRVLTLAVPSGVIVAAATFTTYLLSNPGPHLSDLAQRQAGTAALVTLIVVATWVLAVVARPYQLWKLALLVASASAYVAIFTLPFSQQLFLLDPGDPALLREALLVGLAGAVLVELSWSVQCRRLGQPLRYWSRRTASAG